MNKNSNEDDEEQSHETKENIADSMKSVFSLGYYYVIALHSRAGFMHMVLNMLETLQLLHFVFSSSVFHNLYNL